MAQLLDTTHAGVIQLDRRGRIGEANERARKLLRSKDGLFDQGGTLRAAHAADDARLGDLLARALPPFGGQAVSGSMMVRRSSPHGFALHVTPVANREADHRTRHVAAIVLIVNPLSRARVEPHVVQAVLGLSPSEAEIAVLLAEGRTLHQIARATGRSYNTVRAHLKNMFAKLEVSRQFELAQVVLSLSSLSPARD